MEGFANDVNVRVSSFDNRIGELGGRLKDNFAAPFGESARRAAEEGE